MRMTGTFLRFLEDAITYPFIQHNIVVFWDFVSYPFTMSSGILFIFFWIDVTSKSMYRGAFLDKAFWPCLFLLTSLTIAVFILAGLDLNETLYFASLNYLNIIVTVITLLASLAYFLAAYKIYRFFQRRPDYNKGLLPLCYKIVASGILTLLVVIFAFAQITVTSVFQNLCTRAAEHVILLARSILCLEILRVKPESSKTSNTSSTAEISSTNSINTNEEKTREIVAE